VVVCRRISRAARPDVSCAGMRAPRSGASWITLRILEITGGGTADRIALRYGSGRGAHRLRQSDWRSDRVRRSHGIPGPAWFGAV